HHRSRRAQGERAVTERRAITVDTPRDSFLAVHVVLQDGIPAVREVLHQFTPDQCGAERDRTRADQRRRVLRGPELVDHRTHQAQYAARALELLESGPLGIEPVEQFRMHRIGGTDPGLVLSTRDVGRELARVLLVEELELASRDCDLPRLVCTRLYEESA